MQRLRTLWRRKGHRSLGLMALVAILGAAPTALGAGEQLALEYTFERPQFTQVKIDGIEYERIVMPGCPNAGDIGSPALPARGARILIPFGMEVAKIEARGEKISLGNGYLIEPVAPPARLQSGPASWPAHTPNSAIYASPAPLPASVFEEIGTFGFRGYRILILKLNPVEYVPATGELSYYPNLSVISVHPARAWSHCARSCGRNNVNP